MKTTAFPCIIDLELKDNYGNWNVELSYVVKNVRTLYLKMETLRCMYALDRDYRIMLTLNSKVNKKVIKKRGVK